MKRIIYFAVYALFVFTSYIWGQRNVIILPKKFSDFKTENQFNLNYLSKLALERRGFEVYYENEIPKDYLINRCDMLTLDIQDKSGSFSCALVLQFKDCTNQVVLESEIGKSREKDFKLAYNQAFRQAEKSLIEPLIFDQFEKLYQKNKVLSPKETTPTVVHNDIEILYAQPIENGFQLIDATPKVVYKIYYTSQKEIFTAIKNDQQGILLKNNNQWFFEYAKDGEIKKEPVNIKF